LRAARALRRWLLLTGSSISGAAGGGSGSTGAASAAAGLASRSWRCALLRPERLPRRAWLSSGAGTAAGSWT
jgi:hypothetical protein